MTPDEPDKPKGVPAPYGVNDPDVIEHRALVKVDQPEDGYEQRSFASKMFGIGFSGWFQLAVISVVVGAVFQAGGVDFFSPTFTWGGLPGGILNGALAVFGWAIEIGWRPLITGALVVGPIWLAWRLLSVPFRH